VRWEYRTAWIRGMGCESQLNAFGADGWELLSVSGPDEEGDLWCVFKRRTVSPPAPIPDGPGVPTF
jgi:hypothetical protein